MQMKKKKIKKAPTDKYDLEGSIILIHGPPKVGKTATAASFPKPLFIATEPGHKYLPDHCLKPIVVREWAKVNNLRNLIDRKKPKTVIFDTISGLYRLCKYHECEKKNANHPSDLGEFGRTVWDKIGDTFARALGDLVEHCHGLGITVVFLDHTKEREVETATETVVKVMCGMPGQARGFVTPYPDHIWFMGYGGKGDEKNDDKDELLKNFSDSRILHLQGGTTIEAGCRDDKMLVKRICPLRKPNYEKKTGGYFQIVKEMARGN